MISKLLRHFSKVHDGAISFPEIRELVGRDDPVIFEVGANNGAQTNEFLDVFPNARVFAFEPDPRAIARFKSIVSDPRATLIEAAIGDRDGTISFHQSDGGIGDVQPEGGWDMSGSIRAPKEHLSHFPGITFDSKIEVPIFKLDTWCKENGISQIDFLWADVQGAECDLVRGGPETLSATRFFYTEYSNREMYEGQWSLRELTENLPKHKVMKRWREDVLFALRDQ